MGIIYLISPAGDSKLKYLPFRSIDEGAGYNGWFSASNIRNET